MVIVFNLSTHCISFLNLSYQCMYVLQFVNAMYVFGCPNCQSKVCVFFNLSKHGMCVLFNLSKQAMVVLQFVKAMCVCFSSCQSNVRVSSSRQSNICVASVCQNKVCVSSICKVNVCVVRQFVTTRYVFLQFAKAR